MKIHEAHGEHISTYPNSTIKESLAYDEEGKVHGKWCRYWPNGTVMTEVSYNHGVLHGPHTTHRADGRMVLTTTYQDGIALYTTDDRGQVYYDPPPAIAALHALLGDPDENNHAL